MAKLIRGAHGKVRFDEDWSKIAFHLLVSDDQKPALDVLYSGIPVYQLDDVLQSGEEMTAPHNVLVMPTEGLSIELSGQQLWRAIRLSRGFAEPFPYTLRSIVFHQDERVYILRDTYRDMLEGRQLLRNCQNIVPIQKEVSSV